MRQSCSHGKQHSTFKKNKSRWLQQMLLFLRGISGLVLAHPFCPGSTAPPSLPPQRGAPASQPRAPQPGTSRDSHRWSSNLWAVIYGVSTLFFMGSGLYFGWNWGKRGKKTNTIVGLLVRRSRDTNSLFLIFLCSTQSCLVLFLVLRAKSTESAFQWPHLKM